MLSKFIITTYAAFAFASCLVPRIGIGQEAYQISFADVVFQLNDASRAILNQQIESLERDDALRLYNLQQLSTYLPEVEGVLRENAVPEDFKYLVTYYLFQKSLSTTVLLERGVYWCLDDKKARDVGLTMNKYVDERKHLYAATEGAVNCLRRNQVLYNNWASTLFAHLADREVIDVLQIQRKWKQNRFISLDGSAYAAVLQFLAYKMVMEKGLQQYNPPEQYIVYKYPYAANKDFNTIAANLKVEPAELWKTNEWLKVNYVPNISLPIVVVVPASRFYQIRQLAEISKNTGLSAIDLGFPILSEQPKYAKKRGGKFFEINAKKGIQAELCDDYVNLAYKSKLNVKEFLEINDLSPKDALMVGQVYYLQKKKKKGPIAVHVVQEGERVWDIAHKYGMRQKKLVKYNRLNGPQRLQAGRVVHLQKRIKKNRPIEYIEPVLPAEPLDMLLADPVFAEREQTFEDTLGMTYTEENLLVEPEEIESRVETKEVVIEKSETLKEEEPMLVIQVPMVKTPEQRKEEPRYLTHTVKKGETLYRISVTYKVRLDDLYKLNGLSSNIIEIGDKIKVKKL